MTYIVTSDEYIEIDGVPLDTPAWRTTNLSELLDGAANRSSDVTIPYLPGQQPRRRVRDSREVNIELVIFGDSDPRGAAHANARQGLISNLNELKAALRPINTASAVTRTLVYHGPAGDLTTQVATSSELSLEPVGVTSMRAVVTLTVLSGALRSVTATVVTQSVGTNTTFDLDIEGSGEVLAYTLNVPGAANSITVTNNTTGHGIEVAIPLTTGFELQTASFVALDGQNMVNGSLRTVNTPLWLPLQPGTNSITIQRPGGSNTTATLTYRAVWL